MRKLLCIALAGFFAVSANAQWPDHGKLNVWTSAAVSRTADYDGPIYLKSIRTANQKMFDRLTLEFTGGIPRYDIHTERSGRFDTTGEQVVRVGGKAFMSITLHPMPYPENTADDVPVPKGDL